jgi:hypothetical protein
MKGYKIQPGLLIFWTLPIVWYSRNTQRFEDRSSGWGKLFQINQTQDELSFLNPRTKTSGFGNAVFFEHQTMEKVQKHSNPD